VNNHTTNPYTKERAERLQRKYLQLNSIGLATMSGGHAALGLIYGDLQLAGYFSLFLVFGLAYGFYFKSLSHQAYVLTGELLIVFGVAGTQFFVPSGVASAILLFPLGVTLMAFSQTLLRGGSVFLIGLLVFFSFSYLGFSAPTTSLVPQFLTFIVTLFYCGSVLSYQVNKARKSVESAVLNLVATEAELIDKEGILQKYQTKLRLLNEELDARNGILIETLNSAHEANDILKAERSNQEELTKAIHRDLRDPLKQIISVSEELSNTFNVTPEAKTVSPYLGFAIDGAKRMKTMLDDLLDYTKGNKEQVEEQVDLNIVLVALKQDLSNLIDRSNATVEVGVLPTVVGYPTQLTQLFQNLLSNALKFSRPGVAPLVQVFLAEDQDMQGYCKVVVRDNGVGIPSNQINNVFGLFNRAHAEEGYEGSGVGLALCRRIAVAHDAEISVTSILGEGTQFAVAFPVASVVDSTILKEEDMIQIHQNID